MKYLKKFNEELNPNTYRKIADKLTTHPTKRNDMLKHADDLQRREYIKKCRKIMEFYSKFSNTVKCDVNFNSFPNTLQTILIECGFTKPLNFYPVYEIDSDWWFKDEYPNIDAVKRKNNNVYFEVVEGFIPADEETMNIIFDISKEVSKDYRGWNLVDNEASPILFDRMFIIEVNGETGNVSIPEGRDRDWITGKFKLCDDSGAKTCLNILKKAFTEQIDYPIHKDKTINFYDWIEANIVTLISSEWGSVNSVEDITDFFFRKYSNKSLFYQELNTSYRKKLLNI
jgi:hypothetical protein